MLRALLLIARWIGLAHDRWRAQVARRRPLAAEVNFLYERIDKLKAENDLQFRARQVRSYLKRRRVRRRFAAVGEPNLARLDRFWRTLKDEYARKMFLYEPLGAIEQQLGNYVGWYNRHRPNWALGRRTPDEVHRGHAPRRKRAVQAGVLSGELFQEDRRLPVFTMRPAA